MKCPTCKKTRQQFESTEFLPFCSDRCRLADFGKWLDGDYKVSRPLRMEDEVLMEEIPIEQDIPEEGIQYE